MGIPRIIDALKAWGAAVDGLSQLQQMEDQLYQSGTGTWETNLPLKPGQEPQELRATAERCQRVVANFAQGGPDWITQLLTSMQGALRAVGTDAAEFNRLRSEVQKRQEALQQLPD